VSADREKAKKKGQQPAATGESSARQLASSRRVKRCRKKSPTDGAAQLPAQLFCTVNDTAPRTRKLGRKGRRKEKVKAKTVSERSWKKRILASLPAAVWRGIFLH
jgi:hypothetical protein